MYDAFWKSLSFFSAALLMHVVVSLIKNGRRPAKTKAWGVLQALFMVQPAIESYHHWSGKAMEDDDVISPVQILIAGRAIEIVLESIPEVVIQAGIAIQQPEKATPLLYSSICSSIATACVIMTDTSISYDLAGVNRQERGRRTHPHYGLIPSGKWGFRMLYLGGFFFYIGYLGTIVAAITMFMLVHSARWVALYLVAEFAVVFLILVKTGRKYFILTSSTSWSDVATSVFLWFLFYLMQQFVPLADSRLPNLFGGAWFARWITWRLVANTVVFALLANKQKDTVLWRYYGALLGAAVVGIGLVKCNVSDTHRWTLYQTRLSAKGFVMQYFYLEIKPDSLETTADGWRVYRLVKEHPSYFEPEAVLDFLLTLEIDNQIFAEDAMFGKSASREEGKTYDSWFDKILERIKFYSKMHGELVAKATTHLEVLRAELKQRKKSKGT